MPTASRPPLGLWPVCLYMLPEEVLRDLDVDAGAVAGLAVGVDRAPVPHGLERRDAGLDHIAPRRAVERCNQPHSAGIVLEGGVVEAEALTGLSGIGMVLSAPSCGCLPLAIAFVPRSPGCSGEWSARRRARP